LNDIFLSHNREDQSQAKVLAEGFEHQEFKVWRDVDLILGEAYDEANGSALGDRNKTPVPCMIGACEWPIMFEFTRTTELSHKRRTQREIVASRLATRRCNSGVPPRDHSPCCARLAPHIDGENSERARPHETHTSGPAAFRRRVQSHRHLRSLGSYPR
jgi:hypothetical protein